MSLTREAIETGFVIDENGVAWKTFIPGPLIDRQRWAPDPLECDGIGLSPSDVRSESLSAPAVVSDDKPVEHVGVLARRDCQESVPLVE